MKVLIEIIRLFLTLTCQVPVEFIISELILYRQRKAHALKLKENNRNFVM
jgi:hypothetical protein